MNCPHCRKRLHNGLCMDRLCTFSITGGPEPDFAQLRSALGDTRFVSTLDMFGFASIEQIRSPKMRRVIGFVMRRHIALLDEFAGEVTAVGGGRIQ